VVKEENEENIFPFLLFQQIQFYSTRSYDQLRDLVSQLIQTTEQGETGGKRALEYYVTTFVGG
jgi:hypothetical protein